MAKPTKKKILVNVYKPLRTRLNERVENACLQRDAYLDHVLRNEAVMLEKELTSPNSADARNHLAEHLGLLDRIQVNLSLQSDTVDAINKACESRNVPRDAFINRIFLFLVMPQRKVFRQLLFIDIDWYWVHRVLDKYSHEAPLTPEHLEGSLEVLELMVNEDPFWAYRACLEAAREEGDDAYEPLHQALIRKDFFSGLESSLGFNCYLPDSLIEGHPAQIAAQKELDSLFEGLKDINENNPDSQKPQNTNKKASKTARVKK